MNGIGYKWIRDAESDVYIVELQVFCGEEQNPRIGDLFEWITNDCIVNKILRFRDGLSVSEIKYSAYFPFDYRVREHITGKTVSYCISLDELMKSQRGGIKYAFYMFDKITHGKFQPADNSSPYFDYFHYLFDVLPVVGKIPGLTDSIWKGINNIPGTINRLY